MLLDFLIGALASAITGVALWAVLPRGVTLVRAVSGVDTWTVTNDSPLPVRLVSVEWSGFQTVEGETVTWRPVPVPEQSTDAPVVLTPADVQQIYSLSFSRGGWKDFVLPPGDTMQATVSTNTTLRIRYRRAGAMGVFEKRELMVHGGV